MGACSISPTRSSRFALLLVTPIMLVLGLAPGLSAQTVQARFQLAERNTFEGLPVTLDLRISGTDSPEVEDPKVDGLIFERITEGVSTRRRSIINGRVSSYIEYLVRWQVEGERAGQFTIKSPKISVNGQTVTAPSVRLQVLAGTDQDDLVIEYRADAQSVVIGQEVTVTVDLFMKHLPPPARGKEPLQFHDRGFMPNLLPPEVSIPWFPKPPFGESGFDLQAWADENLATQGDKGWRFANIRRGLRFRGETRDLTRKDSKGKDARYRRYRFAVALRADQAGRYDFGRVSVRGHIAVKRGNEFVKSSVFARSAPLSITIAEPPTEGRPPSFSGAVGTFSLKLPPPTPSEVSVGDPVYLTLTVAGKGFLDGVELDLGRQLGEQFKVDRPKITDVAPKPGSDGLRKRQFDVKIRPRSEKVTEVPALRFSWYDSEKGAYVTEETKVYPLTVRPAGTAIGGSGIVDATGGTARKPGATELVAAGLSPNVDDLNRLDDERPTVLPLLLAVIALLPLYFVVAFFVNRHRALHADPAILRRKNAKSRALARLKSAQQAKDLNQATLALRGFVADLENREEEAITSGDLQAFAELHELAPKVQAAAQTLAEQSEAMSFGGAGLSAQELGPLLTQAQAFVTSASTSKKQPHLRSASLLILAATAVCGPLASEIQAQDKDLFRLSQTAFQEGDFEASAKHLEAMLKDGYGNGIVYYNLGNAWLKADQLGRAIAAYRQAERYLPTDANLNRNLELARSRRKQVLSLESDRTLLDSIFFWRRSLSLGRQVTLSLLFGLLAFGVALLGLYLGKKLPAIRIALALLMLLTLLLVVGSFLTWKEQEPGQYGAVTMNDTIIRQYPELTAEPAFETAVHDGAAFTLLERREGWLRVRLADRYEGWLPATHAVTW